MHLAVLSLKERTLFSKFLNYEVYNNVAAIINPFA